MNPVKSDVCFNHIQVMSTVVHNIVYGTLLRLSNQSCYHLWKLRLKLITTLREKKHLFHDKIES